MAGSVYRLYPLPASARSCMADEELIKSLSSAAAPNRHREWDTAVRPRANLRISDMLISILINQSPARREVHKPACETRAGASAGKIRDCIGRYLFIFITTELLVMAEKTMEKKLLNYFHALTKREKEGVLNYLRSLLKKNRSENENLLKFSGTISADDLKLMEESINEDCGRVDKDEW